MQWLAFKARWGRGGGGKNTPTRCNRNRDKLRPDGPLGSYADFSFFIILTFGSVMH